MIAEQKERIQLELGTANFDVNIAVALEDCIGNG